MPIFVFIFFLFSFAEAQNYKHTFVEDTEELARINSIQQSVLSCGRPEKITASQIDDIRPIQFMHFQKYCFVCHEIWFEPAKNDFKSFIKSMGGLMRLQLKAKMMPKENGLFKLPDHLRQDMIQFLEKSN